VVDHLIYFTLHVPLPLQMSLRGRCMSMGTLVLIYGATNNAPTQKTQPSLSSKNKPHFEMHKYSRKEQKFGYGSRWAPKPRMNVEMRFTSNLLLFYVLSPRMITVNNREIPAIKAVCKQFSMLALWSVYCAITSLFKVQSHLSIIHVPCALMLT
jgi:hypothetical protein